ncbi:MAG TPA: hypothetical protein VFR97_03790 [Capillimicrobium sp.]|nr:hypothetical protein [Capillimicrobium sp.]
MTARDRPSTLLRAVLAALAFGALSVGLQASFAPRSFYDDFPLGGAWVEMLPPYNQHLVTDIGGFQLAFGLLFAWAAVRPARALVIPLCGAWLVGQVLHLVFHVTHFDGFSTGDAIAQTVALVVIVALPVAAIGLARHEQPIPR